MDIRGEAEVGELKKIIEGDSSRRRNGSIIVIADTHFGQRNGEFFEPDVFSSFLRWVKKLETNGKWNLGSLDPTKDRKVLVAPDKMILLGDILELWDASDRSVDICVRTIFPLLSELKCEKIYVLGNHDDILDEIASNRRYIYPMGASGLRIIENEYPEQDSSEDETKKIKTLRVGNEDYLFVHGQQFDGMFASTGRAYRIIPWMRVAAEAFGKFTWLFVILFLLGTLFAILGLLSPWFLTSWSVLIPSWWMFVLLGLLAIPRLVISVARPAFSHFKNIRYKRVKEGPFKDWWRDFSHRKEYPLKNLNIVFGHTHLIDKKSVEEPDLTLLNVPSWIKDERLSKNDEKRKIKDEKPDKEKKKLRRRFEDVFRAAFLYIDEMGYEFVGWDWEEEKPFLIPKEVVRIRREQKDLKDEELRPIKWSIRKLKKIGWPDKLIEKWEDGLLEKQIKRSVRDAVVQRLRRRRRRRR